MFYRFQYGHYSLEEMQAHNSEDGGDGFDTGLCATETPEELFRNTVWASSDDHEAEVVIFRGQIVDEIYDGVRVYPTEVVEYLKPSEFKKRYS